MGSHLPTAHRQQRWTKPIPAFALLISLSCNAAAMAEESAWLSRIGVDRGICVLIDSQPLELAKSLAEESELTIYVQLPDAEAVRDCRRALDAVGILGTRVYVEQGEWSQLHLATNLADVVIATRRAADSKSLDLEELLRVVRPLGCVWFGQTKHMKPYPKQADDWTHPYHGPDNNPLSRDSLAKAPYLTQFLAEPYYSPFPEVTVACRGRIFKAFGNVGYKQRDWPWVNKLVAINGYNGTILWTRELEEGFNIHRNTMVAAADSLYLADSRSCKEFDAASGRMMEEITVPAGATGEVWKWMAIQDGILFAMVGEVEQRDETIRGTRTAAGWPWRPMTSGYDQADYPWGFGKSLFAMDLKTKRLLWLQTDVGRIDGRAIAMKGQRIYCYSPGVSLACVDAATGNVIWQNRGAELLEAIGPDIRSQTARLGFASSAYMKCDEQAIYFAGPQRARMVTASAEDGHLLWKMPHGNYQLVLRQEGLYALGRTSASFLLDPLSGEVREELHCLRGNCTRVTGTVDSVFARGHDHAGTLRLPVADNQPRRIGVMRPACHDGVIASGGNLYWGPWMCDCSLTLVGHICLTPAGEFRFQQPAVESERLETSTEAQRLKPLATTEGDWTTYRADNRRSGVSEVETSPEAELLWQYMPPKSVETTSPVSAGGFVFLGGSDGVVRALDAKNGNCRWTAFTGGSVLYPPSIEGDRLFVGSSDGWLYALEAATGRRLWRFRVAPAERKISVYGRLVSTWPVASGVLVADGVAYAAAGIASYDGTHVVALDAATGKIRWQNNTTGHLFGGDRVTGVSVQGHMLLDGNRLYLAGGNVVSPAVFDVENGRLLNEMTDEWGGQRAPALSDWDHPELLEQKAREQKRWGKSPRGCDLFLIDGKVTAFDRLLYAPKRYWAGRYFPLQGIRVGQSDRQVLATTGGVARLAKPDATTPLPPPLYYKRPRSLTLSQSQRPTGANQGRPSGSSPSVGGPAALWQSVGFERPKAMAVTRNAVLVAGQAEETAEERVEAQLTAYDSRDGRVLWNQSLPAVPAWWGLATTTGGDTLLTLQNGNVMCFGRPSRSQ